MKVLVASGVALGLLISAVPAPVFAQTSTSNTVQVETLLKQIKQLQDQLAELSKQRAEVGVELKDALALAADLRQGMTSEEVKALQEILAADPEIYPEGVVSGFYGPLTAKAVAKFQKKHGIEGEAAVGMKTRARINALADDKDFRCKAWGKLIAPGQMKKRLGNATIDLSMCGKVPEGIQKKLDGDWRTGTSSTATSTDRFAPVISRVDIDDITDDSAMLTFWTSEPAQAAIWYSTENDLDDAEVEENTKFVKEHEFEFEDLEADTDYYYRIVVTDKAGNSATSTIRDFETEEED